MHNPAHRSNLNYAQQVTPGHRKLSLLDYNLALLVLVVLSIYMTRREPDAVGLQYKGPCPAIEGTNGWKDRHTLDEILTLEVFTLAKALKCRWRLHGMTWRRQYAGPLQGISSTHLTQAVGSGEWFAMSIPGAMMWLTRPCGPGTAKLRLCARLTAQMRSASETPMSSNSPAKTCTENSVKLWIRNYVFLHRIGRSC